MGMCNYCWTYGSDFYRCTSSMSPNCGKQRPSCKPWSELLGEVLIVVDMPGTELHPAFTWDCDNCGRENIARLLEITDPEYLEQLRDLRDSVFNGDVEPEAHGFLAIPSTVICKFCKREYLAGVPDDVLVETGDDADTDDGDPPGFTVTQSCSDEAWSDLDDVDEDDVDIDWGDDQDWDDDDVDNWDDDDQAAW